MTAADPRSEMLFAMSQCAYRLGLAFGQEAERAEDVAGKLEYFALFDRCFFAMRVATALELRLRRTAAASWETVAEREDERTERAEPPERERSGAREDSDRDREREAEPASLPVLLRTLDGIAADAAALPGPEPAALPTLRELLAHVAPEPSPTPSPRPPRTDLRARLAGSGAAVTLKSAPRPASVSGGIAVRRATGPPRR